MRIAKVYERIVRMSFVGSSHRVCSYLPSLGTSLVELTFYWVSDLEFSYAARDRNSYFTLASLVCLIAAVLLTSKYEIRIIKENGKTRSASCFTYGIVLWIVVRDVTS